LNIRTLIWRSLEAVKWYLKSRTVYRVHSPGLYQLLFAMQMQDTEFYAFDEIEQLRTGLLHSTQVIDYLDYGAGPGGVQPTGVRKMKVSELARKSASSPLQGELLFRMVNHLQPDSILELGASLGIGSSYLCAPNRKVFYRGIEGNPQSAEIAQKHLTQLGCGNARVLAGAFQEYLPKALKQFDKIDFAYIDGDHREASTLAYFTEIEPYLSEKAVLVFDDIYWSPGMLSAFEQLRALPQVRASLDLWEMGVLFFDPAFQEKVHFRVAQPSWKLWEKYV
jgi:predicted O-methyltransferase YrrM